MSKVSKQRRDGETIDVSINNFIQLMRRSLHLPAQTLCDPNWSEICHLAYVQRMAGVISFGLDGLEPPAPPETQRVLKNKMLERGMYTDKLLFDADAFVDKLHEAGVECLILKGPYLRRLYPHPYLRQMSDVDLFVREEDRESALAIAERLGYTLEFSDIGDTTVNIGIPKSGFLELHSIALDSVSYVAGTDPMFTSPWSYARPDPELSRHGLFLHDEECFIFVVQHFAKHMEFKGAGLRMLLDVALMSRLESVDWASVQARMEVLSLKHFTDVLFALAGRYLDVEPPEGWTPVHVSDEMITETLYYLLNRDNPGYSAESITSLNIRRRRSVVKGARVRFFFRQAFPSVKRMRGKRQYAYLKACPVLLPAAWVHRAVYVVFKEHAALGELLRALLQRRKVVDSKRSMLSWLGISRLFDDLGQEK